MGIFPATQFTKHTCVVSVVIYSGGGKYRAAVGVAVGGLHRCDRRCSTTQGTTECHAKTHPSATVLFATNIGHGIAHRVKVSYLLKRQGGGEV